MPPGPRSPRRDTGTGTVDLEELRALAAELDLYAVALSRREDDIREREREAQKREDALRARECALISTWNSSSEAADIGVRVSGCDPSEDAAAPASERIGVVEGCDGEDSIAAQQMRIENLARALRESPLRVAAHTALESDVRDCIARLKNVAVSSRAARANGPRSNMPTDILRPQTVDDRVSDVRIDPSGAHFMVNLLQQKVPVLSNAVRPRQSVSARRDAREARVELARARREAEVRKLQRGEHRQPELPIYAQCRANPRPVPPRAPLAVADSSRSPPCASCGDLRRQHLAMLTLRNQIRAADVSLKQREETLARDEAALRELAVRLQHKQQWQQGSRDGHCNGSPAALFDRERAISEREAAIAELEARATHKLRSAWADLEDERSRDEAMRNAHRRSADLVLSVFRRALEDPAMSCVGESPSLGSLVGIPLSQVEAVVANLLELRAADRTEDDDEESTGCDSGDEDV